MQEQLLQSPAQQLQEQGDILARWRISAVDFKKVFGFLVALDVDSIVGVVCDG